MLRAPDQSRKVAIFLPALYGGGAERISLKLAGGIASRGIPVDLVLARREGPYISEVPKTVHIIDLKAARDLVALPALVRYLRKEKSRVLLSGLHANLIAVWAKRLAGEPQAGRAHLAAGGAQGASEAAQARPAMSSRSSGKCGTSF